MINYKNFRTLISVMIVITITGTSVTAYAFNSDYVGNQSAWYDNGYAVSPIDEKTMNAACLYKIDSDDGCFYMYLHYDVSDYPDKEIIEIGFEIINDKNTYKFSVCQNGFSKNSSQNAKDNIYLEQKFDNQGRIFIGFKLLNSSDRLLNSNVKCEFASGSEQTITLIDNAVIEMFVPEITKPSASNHQTTKKASASPSKKATTASAKPTAPSDSNKTSREKGTSTTKFKASGITTTEKSSSKASSKGTVNSTKFHANSQSEGNTSAQTAQSETTEFDFFSMLDSDESSETESNGRYERTKQAKLAIVLAFVIFVIGVSLLVFALLKKGNKEPKEVTKVTEDNKDE